MKVIVVKDYEEMSLKAFEVMAEVVKNKLLQFKKEI